MSQSEGVAVAGSSKLVVGSAKFISGKEIERKENRGIDINLIDSQNGPKVKGYLTENVKKRSKNVDEIAEIDVVGDKDEDENNIQLLDSEVILNEDIIIEISKYLGFQDLKSLRRVNKLWSAGATGQLVKNSVISLIYRKRSKKQLLALGAETENLKGIRVLKINLNMLLIFGFDKEVEIFRDIFSKNAPTLQSLELNQWFDDAFFFTGGGASISLPSLTAITFKNGYLDICTKREVGHSQSLYAAAPNLNQLVIRRFSPTNILSPLLSEDGSRNWSLAPKLKSLTTNISLYSENNSSEYWLPLVFFPQMWENLDITLAPFNGADMEALFRLLEKNKDCLVTLKLEIEDDELPFSPQPYTLRLPATFSKLKKLELQFFSLKLHDGVTFGGRGLNFSEALPNLTSLSVKLPISLVDARGIWSSLFPPQVFRGLKHLEVEGTSHIRFLPNVEVVQNWAAGIFPQATTEISLA